MERAVEWYHERLLRSPDAGPARDYLRSRGYDGDIVRQFRLGWAPDDWDALAKAPQAPREGAVGLGPRLRQPARPAAGLLPGPRPVPDLRPLRAPRSPSAGASCRPGPGQPPPDRPEPKYKNSQESPIYSKRRTLYALNWAKKGIVATGRGRGVRGLHRRHRLLPGRRALGRRHLRHRAGRGALHLLRNFAKRIVLAYDADAAGQSATSRVYEWERKHEVDVVVAICPVAATPATWPAPTRRRWPGHQGGPPVPPVPGGPHAGRGRPDDGRGPGPGRRGGAHGGGRASRRPGARPVRDAARRPLQDRPALVRERLEHLAGPSARAPAQRTGPAARTSPRRTTPRTTATVRPRTPAPHVAQRDRAGARGAQVGRPSTRRCSGSSAPGALHRPRAAAGVRRRSWRTTASTRRWSPRHRRWRACCDASLSKSPWSGDPELGIRSTPWPCSPSCCRAPVRLELDRRAPGLAARQGDDRRRAPGGERQVAAGWSRRDPEQSTIR